MIFFIFFYLKKYNLQKHTNNDETIKSKIYMSTQWPYKEKQLQITILMVKAITKGILLRKNRNIEAYHATIRDIVSCNNCFLIICMISGSYHQLIKIISQC